LRAISTDRTDVEKGAARQLGVAENVAKSSHPSTFYVARVARGRKGLTFGGGGQWSLSQRITRPSGRFRPEALQTENFRFRATHPPPYVTRKKSLRRPTSSAVPCAPRDAYPPYSEEHPLSEHLAQSQGVGSGKAGSGALVSPDVESREMAMRQGSRQRKRARVTRGILWTE